MTTKTRSHWGNRIGFILAAAGSAIGLGNMWKFPYLVGNNGGSAFVLVYLLCIALVGLPILVAEVYLGQAGQKNAVETFDVLDKKGTPWRSIGFMGILAAFLILSFYSVVGGWVLDFEYRSLTNQFAGHSDESIKSFLGGLFSDPIRQIFWHFVFMAATVGVVIGGVKNGIEKWNRFLMPALAVILVLLFIRVLFLDGFPKAMSYLFTPDFSKLTTQSALEALGQAFFTLSIGLGIMLTYGSYLSKKESVLRTAFTVAVLDTGIAIVSGIVIFSVVFSFGLEAGAGPTLMFKTLPMLFQKMTGSYILSTAFFLLVAFAALTSSISLLEGVVAYWTETRGTSRKITTIAAGGICFLVGILSALSFNVLSDTTILGQTFFGLFDQLTSTILLPLGGMLIALFMGWKLGLKHAKQACQGFKNPIFANGFLFLVRFLAPLGVLVFLVRGIRDWVG